MASPAFTISAFVPAGWRLSSDPAIQVLTAEDRAFWLTGGVGVVLNDWVISIWSTTPTFYTTDEGLEDFYRFAVVVVSATGVYLRQVELGWLTAPEDQGGTLVDVISGTLATDLGTTDDVPPVDTGAADGEPEPEEPAGGGGDTTSTISTGTVPPTAPGMSGDVGLAFLLALALRSAEQS